MQEFLDKIGSIANVQKKDYKDSYIENKIKAFIYDYCARELINRKQDCPKAFIYDVEDIRFIEEGRGIYSVNANFRALDIDSMSKPLRVMLKLKEEADWWTIIHMESVPQIGGVPTTGNFNEYIDKNILKLRSIAAVYYSFCLFEAPKKNLEAIVNCYAKEFEVLYPWGGCKTNEQLIKWVSGISEKSSYAHHVRNISITDIQKAKVHCTVDVTYQTVNDSGEFRSMELKYEFVIEESGEGFPRISKSITTVKK